MHSSFRSVDIVCKRDQHLIVAVVILHGDLGDGIASHVLHVDNAAVQGSLVSVDVFNEFPDAALIAHLVVLLFARPQISGGYL